MADIYHEQLVKRRPTSADGMKKAGVIAGCVLLFFAVTAIYVPIAIFVLAGECFGAWYLFTYFDIEYEYSFTSGELDIDRVYAKRRRKRVVTVDVRGVEAIRKLRDGERPPKNEKNLDCGGGGEAPYVIVANIKNQRTTIVFEPNEDMLKAMAPFAGRKLTM